MKFKRPPRQKQLEALEFLKGKRYAALFMEMRVGKTFCILNDWQRIVAADTGIGDLLVVAPGSVYKVWEKAITDDVDDDLRAATLQYTWESDKALPRHVKGFLAFKGPRILLINAEAFVTERARDFVIKLLAQHRCMMVIDESTLIKNPKAARTKFLLSIAPLAKCRRILSGLPTPRSPFDIYCQMQWLGPILDFKDYKHFTYRYGVFRKKYIRGGAGKEPTDNPFSAHGAKSLATKIVHEVVGYKRLDELQRKIAPHSFRVLLSECTDLPKSLYSIREVRITDEQRRLYNDLKRYSYAALEGGEIVTADIVIVKMLRLQQILLGRAVDEDGETHDIKEHRTEALIELFNETAEKAVVFCSYDADVVKISAALRKEFGDDSVARFWGGNRTTREAEEKDFQTRPGCRFMVATAAAGGMGRDWSAASIVVFYSNRDNLEHRMQGESRPLAVGKTKPILYVDLQCSGTVDEKFITAMRKKLNLAAEITGDNFKQWLI
jgi:SNF2 family DNA or RNA helicase